jgi:putative ABC transport system permease protein
MLMVRGRRTSLAVRNLLHQPTRTAVSVLGIAFAILLMFMQLGFLGSVGETATIVYQRTPGELIVRSSEYLSMYDPRTIDETVLNRLATLPGVTHVRPLDIGVASWQNPFNGEFLAVAMMGIDIDRPAVEMDDLPRLLPLLRQPEHVLVDRTSRADFGPQNGVAFGDSDIGVTTEINFQNVRVAGTFEMGTGLAANGAVLTSREGFCRLTGGDGRSVSMVFVELDRDADIEAQKQSILEMLRRGGGTLAHAHVLTRADAESMERQYWYLETPVGMIFWIGVALAVVVGGVICYMVLAADVIARLPEYATLKALGYSTGYLGRTLLLQSTLLALIALPVATLAALALFEVTSAASGLPIRMTWLWLALVSTLSIVMCGVAAMLALRKLSKAEPASLF